MEPGFRPRGGSAQQVRRKVARRGRGTGRGRALAEELEANVKQFLASE